MIQPQVFLPTTQLAELLGVPRGACAYQGGGKDLGLSLWSKPVISSVNAIYLMAQSFDAAWSAELL